MKVTILLFIVICTISFISGCRRADHYLQRRLSSTQCSVRSQSTLAGTSYSVTGDSLMFSHDWSVTVPWFAETHRGGVGFHKNNDTIEVRGLMVAHPHDREPRDFDSIIVAYNIILDGEGKAVQYYSLEYAEYPTYIEYENGRVKRIWSEPTQGLANFTYDERGNVIEIVADDITSLSNQLSFEYGDDSVLFNVPIHPTVYAGFEFFTMQVKGWVPPLAKYQKTKSVYFDREAQQIISQVNFSDYNTDFLGRISSFEASGEKVRLGWQCNSPSIWK